jgi:hypothetical protein
MGKLATVTHEGSEIILSMIKWGALRRMMLSCMHPINARLGVGSPTQFIPQYEIAIYDGSSKVVFPSNPHSFFIIRTKKPPLKNGTNSWRSSSRAACMQLEKLSAMAILESKAF